MIWSKKMTLFGFVEVQPEQGSGMLWSTLYSNHFTKE